VPRAPSGDAVASVTLDDAARAAARRSGPVLLPYATAVGSPNYGYRSVHKDVESEVVLVSTDPAVRHAMRGELDRLMGGCKVAHESQFVGDNAGRFQPVVALVASLGQAYL
jgi:CDP-diacylglycerol--glycerol-3-phosphate 3-phosphatidyltransferase